MSSSDITEDRLIKLLGDFRHDVNALRKRVSQYQGEQNKGRKEKLQTRVTKEIQKCDKLEYDVTVALEGFSSATSVKYRDQLQHYAKSFAKQKTNFELAVRDEVEMQNVSSIVPERPFPRDLPAGGPPVVRVETYLWRQEQVLLEYHIGNKLITCQIR